MSIRGKLLPLIQADERAVNQIARDAGIPPQTLAAFVSGERPEPKAEMLVHLLRVLGVKPRDIGPLLLDAYPARPPRLSAAEMREMVAEEQRHIADYPKGPQTEMRAYYQTARMNALGGRAEVPGETAAACLAVAIRAERRRHPGFVPQYDAEFFGPLPEVQS